MRAKPEQETELLTTALSLAENPYEFVQWAYPWGDDRHPTLKHGLRKWQAEDIRRLGDHVLEQAHRMSQGLPLQVYREARSSGRGPGKSAKFGMIAHWHMSTHLGAPTIVAANNETQLRTRTFPEFAVWFGCAINSHWFVQETLKITPAKWLLEQIQAPIQKGGLGIDPKYWYVVGQMWNEDNPDAFAGAHNPYGMLLLFDEASGIPSSIWNTAEGFYTEINPFRFHLAASQMRKRQGRFYEIFHDEKQGQGWDARTISTRGMEGIDQTLIDRQISVYGEDSDFVRVEIDGLAPQTSEDQFISADAVNAARKNDFYHDDGEPLILGVDPGKTMAWWFRQGRNARDCCGPSTRGQRKGLDAVQAAKHIEDLLNLFPKTVAVCIDCSSDTSMYDILRRKSWLRSRLHAVKFGAPAYDKDSEGATRVFELWKAMKDWLPNGMIPQDDGAKGTPTHQMTDRGWKWSGREESKKRLESKDELFKRGVQSPHDADALCCTFEVNPPRQDKALEEEDDDFDVGLDNFWGRR